jgi:hypothetical protein
MEGYHGIPQDERLHSCQATAGSWKHPKYDVYINLEQAIFKTENDGFQVRVAHNVDEACELVEVGFEYVTGNYGDGGKIFRKRN